MIQMIVYLWGRACAVTVFRVPLIVVMPMVGFISKSLPAFVTASTMRPSKKNGREGRHQNFKNDETVAFFHGFYHFPPKKIPADLPDWWEECTNRDIHLHS